MAVNLAPTLVNGVNVENLGKTLNAVKENPRLAVIPSMEKQRGKGVLFLKPR